MWKQHSSDVRNLLPRSDVAREIGVLAHLQAPELPKVSALIRVLADLAALKELTSLYGRNKALLLTAGRIADSVRDIYFNSKLPVARTDLEVLIRKLRLPDGRTLEQTYPGLAAAGLWAQLVGSYEAASAKEITSLQRLRESNAVVRDRIAQSMQQLNVGKDSAKDRIGKAHAFATQLAELPGLAEDERQALKTIGLRLTAAASHVTGAVDFMRPAANDSRQVRQLSDKAAASVSTQPGAQEALLVMPGPPAPPGSPRPQRQPQPVLLPPAPPPLEPAVPPQLEPIEVSQERKDAWFGAMDELVLGETDRTAFSGEPRKAKGVGRLYSRDGRESIQTLATEAARRSTEAQVETSEDAAQVATMMRAMRTAVDKWAQLGTKARPKDPAPAGKKLHGVLNAALAIEYRTAWEYFDGGVVHPSTNLYDDNDRRLLVGSAWLTEDEPGAGVNTKALVSWRGAVAAAYT